MKEEILKVVGLSKNYGALKAVDDLSFTVKKGSVFGILGPNGSGKSTTLGIATQVINASAGQYEWFGSKGNAHSLHHVGALLERPNFYGYMNAIDNLKIVAQIRGVAYDKIDDILHLVGLYERRKSRFKNYSFGMQQRLAIGSAMLGDPEVLILDEPTNGLDPEGIAEIRETILKIARSGKTIIMASHLLDEVQKVCTDVLILRKGKKIYSGLVEDLGKDNIRKFELKADDLNQLIEVAQSHPKIHHVEFMDSSIIIKTEEDVKGSDLNKYFMEYGVVLSHLTLKTASLEHKFLDILKAETPSN